jgi:hypothetical protein
MSNSDYLHARRVRRACVGVILPVVLTVWAGPVRAKSPPTTEFAANRHDRWLCACSRQQKHRVARGRCRAGRQSSGPILKSCRTTAAAGPTSGRAKRGSWLTRNEPAFNHLAEWLAEWGGDRKSFAGKKSGKIVTTCLPTSRARPPHPATGLGAFGEGQGCHPRWQGCHAMRRVIVGASPCQKRTNFKVATKVAKTAGGGGHGSPPR